MDIDEFCDKYPDVWVICLEAAGIDNWDGMDLAVELLKATMRGMGYEPE